MSSSIRSLALLALAVVLAACQGAPPGPVASKPALAALAVEALEMGQYARAADLYRRALEESPTTLALHYGLGVAASRLDLRDEAVREFRWVLEHGEPGSTEVEVARRWLGSVGALPRAPWPAADRSEAVEAAAQVAEPKSELGTVQGLARFGEAGDVKPMQRLKLFLIAQPDRINFYDLRTDEDGRFSFRKVKPGVYMLTTRIVGKPLWRLRVDVKAGQETALDLSPANSLAVRDDFPVDPRR